MRRLDEYLIFNFCKSIIFPTHIHHLELQNPPKFSKRKDWFINIYDFSNTNLINPNGNYFYGISYKPAVNLIIDTHKINFAKMKETKRLMYPNNYFYSTVSNRRIFYLFSLIDVEIENFLFIPEFTIDDPKYKNYKLTKTYYRKDYEKYMVLL